MPVGKSLRIRLRAIDRRRHEVSMFAAAMQQRASPVLAQIIPIQHCRQAVGSENRSTRIRRGCGPHGLQRR